MLQFNNAVFISSISKINNIWIDNAEDLDVVMPMHNLIEYRENYRKPTGNFWNYYRDEPDTRPTDDYNADPITNSALFKSKITITGKASNNNNVNNSRKKCWDCIITKIFK